MSPISLVLSARKPRFVDYVSENNSYGQPGMALVTYKAPKVMNIKPVCDSIEASETKSTPAHRRAQGVRWPRRRDRARPRRERTAFRHREKLDTGLCRFRHPSRRP